MSQIDHIERAIKGLSSNDLATFRKWFDAFDADKWDAALEADVQSGALDGILESALEDYKRGNIREL